MISQLILVVALALVHANAAKLLQLKDIPRSGALSFAGGVSVAYVFILIFPELVEAQEAISDHGMLAYLEYHAYLVALVGLTAFYGLERCVKHSRGAQNQKNEEPDKAAGLGVFWLHIVSFALYNSLIGYLLVYREGEIFELSLFVLAMGFHFLVNDNGLIKLQRSAYLHHGRWILSAAVLWGWGIGQFVKVSEATTSLLFAFLAGGIILNVLKEELPGDRQSRFMPFAVGAGVYATLLLLIAG
ncbi:hypothetical protein [Cellvibrio polysaccharolyticus]|uniref:ZIP Zinc transporter n=1 Tax=Cellvibrio polysaccharolyticus TaxID=2082724 RepID=A0A928V1R8_9GAMM|nr:hypothetical protein [Cellvibrio polysaccharolyticus]MBE8717190.1 hypothetical protein [Cellvibrio polysaccharolyticus]